MVELPPRYGPELWIKEAADPSRSDAMPSDPRGRIERIVHEAMLTARVLPRDRAGSGRVGNSWPEHAYEVNDWGTRPAIGQLDPVFRGWRPTPRQITQMEWVFLECFGKWRNPRSKKNGPEPWQWLLLELRAWQAIYGRRGGWRFIADAITSRQDMPSFSHSWVKLEHGRLIDVAWHAAKRGGD